MGRRCFQLRGPGPGAPPSRRTKRLLVKTGASFSQRAVYGLLGVFNYLHLGWWLKERRFRVRSIASDRNAVFDAIAAAVGPRSVLYLEFGVAKGTSMRYWSRLLTQPDCKLHGFDSFEGLPSGWALGWQEGSFSLQGQIPTFDDERITIYPGLFATSLPQYHWPDGYEQLIVTLDADLYSSTAYVLETIEPRITIGTVLYFDELHQYADELRAFDELLQRRSWTFDILAATGDFSQVAFVRVL